MKVRVRKIELGKPEISFWDKDFNTIREIENRVKDEEESKRLKERAAIEKKVYEEYFAMFPNDDMIFYEDDCDGWIDGRYMSESMPLYLWGIENHKHWWENNNLPRGVVRAPQPDIVENPDEIFFLP